MKILQLALNLSNNMELLRTYVTTIWFGGLTILNVALFWLYVPIIPFGKIIYTIVYVLISYRMLKEYTRIRALLLGQ